MVKVQSEELQYVVESKPDLQVVQPKPKLVFPGDAILMTLLSIGVTIVFLVIITCLIFGFVWGAINKTQECSNSKSTGVLLSKSELHGHYYTLTFDIYQDEIFIYHKYDILIDSKEYNKIDQNHYEVGEQYTMYEGCNGEEQNHYYLHKTYTANKLAIVISSLCLLITFLWLILCGWMTISSICFACGGWIEWINTEDTDMGPDFQKDIV